MIITPKKQRVHFDKNANHLKTGYDDEKNEYIFFQGSLKNVKDPKKKDRWVNSF